MGYRCPMPLSTRMDEYLFDYILLGSEVTLLRDPFLDDPCCSEHTYFILVQMFATIGLSYSAGYIRM